MGNIFDRAIDEIREYGWWDGTPPPSGRMERGSCMVLALRGAGHTQAQLHLAESLGVNIDVPFGLERLYGWNDSHSYEDVILALKEAGSTWTGE